MTDSLYKRIRSGLAANLESLGYEVSQYIRSSPTVPVIEMFASLETPHLTMGASTSTLTFTIRPLVSAAAGPEDSQGALDDIRAGLVTAIESDLTLAGAVDTLIVREISEDRLYTVGGVVYLGFEADIELLT